MALRFDKNRPPDIGDGAVSFSEERPCNGELARLVRPSSPAPERCSRVETSLRIQYDTLTTNAAHGRKSARRVFESTVLFARFIMTNSRVEMTQDGVSCRRNDFDEVGISAWRPDGGHVADELK